MSDETKEAKTFSAEYVAELRQENASWRTKFQEMKGAIEVNAELARCNIKADPSWVKVQEGQTVKEAVKQLMKDHPHLVVQATPEVETDQVEPDDVHSQLMAQLKQTQAPVARDPKTTTPKKTSQQILKERNMAEIKKDPVAREALRQYYRELLQNGSHQKG